MALIELRHLHKVYGSVQALQDLNLEIPEACLYGLLGPNGAGKTTTLRILATLLAPDSGEVRVDGIDALQDPRAVRQRLGYVAQEVAMEGITVNAICPGPIDTPLWRSGPEEWRKWKVDSLPMKRVGTTEELAWAMVYMASDEASYLTGQSISPNGGDIMW